MGRRAIAQPRAVKCELPKRDDQREDFVIAQIKLKTKTRRERSRVRKGSAARLSESVRGRRHCAGRGRGGLERCVPWSRRDVGASGCGAASRSVSAGHGGTAGETAGDRSGKESADSTLPGIGCARGRGHRGKTRVGKGAVSDERCRQTRLRPPRARRPQITRARRRGRVASRPSRATAFRRRRHRLRRRRRRRLRRFARTPPPSAPRRHARRATG